MVNTYKYMLLVMIILCYSFCSPIISFLSLPGIEVIFFFPLCLKAPPDYLSGSSQHVPRKRVVFINAVEVGLP